MFIALRNKRFGEIYRAFWLPEADKVIPYCMYVPVSYDPAKPNKLLVAIHGGGLGEQSIFSLSKGKVQLLAQKYNYIVLCPNACTMGSSYGSPYPPNNGNKHKLAVNKDSADNPQGFSEETLAFKKLGDISVTKTIELIETLYNIDKDHIYMMGNSMGGMGTIYYAYAHKGMIRAIASSGGVLAPEYFPYKDMTGIPVRIIGGTEDYHGFDYIYEAYQAMEAAGLEVELAAVGGGIHYDAWAEVLEGTFEFFEAHA